jgi:hypothetical protein
MQAGPNTMINRMIRAAKLDNSLYDEVEHDISLTQEAAMIIGIVALSGAVSAFLGSLIGGSPLAGLGMAAIFVIMAYVGWVIWSYITYWVGTSLFGGTATPGEMMRCIGYAQSPRVLEILGFIPCLGGLIAVAAGIWSLVASVVAIRQALDFDTGKAIATAVVGWIVVFIIYCTIFMITGMGALMGSMLMGS